MAPRKQYVDDSGSPIAAAKQYVDDYGNPISTPSTNPGVAAPIDPDQSPKMAQSVVYSKMFGIPPSTAYQMHDELNEEMKGLGAHTTIDQAFTFGHQSSIFGLMARHKLPEPMQNPDIFDNFVAGLTEMGEDLPWMFAGGAAAAPLGSEVPILGNAAAASAGAFAVPAAMRKALTIGIKQGKVTSFRDLVGRIGDVALAGGEGAVTGLVTHGAGRVALPIGGESVGLVMRRAQQVAAMTIVPDAFEGRLPTAQEFAVNAAMFGAMHYGAEALGLASIAAPKIHEKLLDMYENHGITPSEVAAEGLARAQEFPNEDPVDRLNNIARDLEAASPKENPETPTQENKDATPVRQEEAEPPEPGLRPAIRENGEVTEGKADGTHDETLAAAKMEETPESERGFVDKEGNFYTREEAAAWVRENEPEVAQEWEKVAGGPDEEFRSEDYNEARQRSTGIKNASVDEQRAQMGLPPIEGPMRVMDPDNWEVAKEQVDSGQVDPLRIAESVNANPRGLTPEETNAMNYYRARLSNEHKAVMDAIEKARSNDDPTAENAARGRLADVENRINTVDTATKRAGTEWGLTGQMRQRMIAEDYSLDRMLQRARVASPTGEIPQAVRDKLESLSDQLEKANKEFEEYRAKASERQAQEVVDRIKKDTARTERKADRVQVRTTLKVEFDGLIKQLDKELSGRLSSNPFLDPKLLNILGKLAKNRIESGLTRIEDVVDDIHGALTTIGYDVNKRDVRDAISGYGKTIEMSKDAVDVALREARRQCKLISALEDAESANLPARSGLQRDSASERVRELQKQVKQAMRESGIDARKSQTPEAQWKTALDSVKTRMRNQIDDLTKQIATGEREAKRTGIVYDEEAKILRDQRDALRETYKQTTGDTGKREMSAEQRINMAQKAMEKQIAEYERRIKENDITPEQRRTGRPEPREVAVLRDRLDAMRETYRQLKEAAEPKKTPEQMALDRFKSYTKKRITDMEGRLKAGDFSKEPPKKTILDPEANELKIKSEKLRNQVDEEIAKQEYNNRSTPEKALHVFSKWRRAALLSGIQVFGKLGAAAMSRMGVTPIEELTGGVLSKVPGISSIADRAPFEGKPSLSAEVKALSQVWQKATLDDVWSELKNGKISLDYLYGDESGRGKMPPSALDFIGNLHGAVKVLPKRAEFFRRLEIGTQWAQDHNLDINDPKVQSAVAAGSYQESLRAIFMQDNVVATTWSIAMNYLHSRGVGGQALEAAGRTMFPIVKVPTNIIAETLQYNPANLAYQTVRLIQTLFDENRMGKSAMDNLTMHDMDNIMRGLKKGTVGLALLGIGYSLRDQIKGYYGANAKDKKKLGTMTIAGVEIPAFLQESPAFATLQMGATMGHVWDHYQVKGQAGGFVAGAGFATYGVAQRLPFLDTPARMAEQTRTPEALGVFAGSLASSIAVPAAVQQVAKWTDREGNEAADAGHARKPTTATEAVEMGIPGLREDVPLGGAKKHAKPAYRFTIKGRK